MYELENRIHDIEKSVAEKGLLVGLDGPNYFKDIRDWHRKEVKKLKDKYGIN